jgi:hypothetical protein
MQQLTLPRLHSFNMADQELAMLNAKIDKAEAYRDELRRGGEGGVVDRDMLFLAQKELVGLQEDKRRYIENQGENLASRSPPHRFSSPHACQRIPGGGPLTISWNFQRDDQLTGGGFSLML